MTTAGFVAGTREDTAPSTCSRVAAGASVLLGSVLIDALPDLMSAAFYLAILAGAAALVAIAAGYVLWTRVTLIARTVALLAAGAVLAAGVLQLLVGLPGVTDLGRLTAMELGAALATPGAVLVFLAVDALRRKPEPAPDRPYAL